MTSIQVALFSILLAWAVAAGISLSVCAVASVEDIGPLLRAALLSSAPVMWLVPALLLISAPSPVAAGLGFLLVANTLRLFVLRGWPRRGDSPRPHRRKPKRILSTIRRTPVWKSETTKFIFGAFALQLGICIALAGYGLAAAALAAAGATLWSLGAISRGVSRPPRSGSVLSAVLTLILTVAISMTQFRPDPRAGSPPTLPQITNSALRQIIHTSPLIDESPKKVLTRIFTPTKDLPLTPITLVEGVTLWPEIVRPKPSRRVWLRSLQPAPFSRQGFHFTGEYHLFPASVKGVSENWSVETGTPVDSVYATVSGRRLQTEAYQALNPAVDITAYRALQITLVSHEDFAAAATVQLIGDRPAPDLGPEIFGLKGRRKKRLNLRCRLRFGACARRESELCSAVLRGNAAEASAWRFRDSPSCREDSHFYSGVTPGLPAGLNEP